MTTALISRLVTAITPLRLALVLGKGVSLRLRILFLTYRLLVLRALKKTGTAKLSLWFRGQSFHITIEDAADLAALREVFLDNEYEHKELEKVETIFDVGANIGVASVYFALRYPRARVHAFEPSPALFTRLKDTASSFPNITVYQRAVADKEGMRTLYTHPNAPLSGSLVHRNDAWEGVSVATSSLSSLAKELGIERIDILKFDIEGGERWLFNSAEDRGLLRFIVGEVHLDLMGSTKVEFEKLLSDFSILTREQTGTHRYIISASAP